MLYFLMALCGIISFIAIRSTFFPLKFGAGLAWFGAFIYWLQANLVTDGSPTDLIVMFTLMFLGLAFFFMGLITRGRQVEVEEQSVGGITRRTAKYTTYENNMPAQTNSENEYQYRIRVRKALESGKHNRRRR